MVGRRGGYARKKVVADDLDVVPYKARSSWERNLMRVFLYQQEQGIVTHWEYETRRVCFPGKSEVTTGNKHASVDFPVVAYIGELGLPGLSTPYHDPKFKSHPSIQIEIKGRLDHGGKLEDIDFAMLNARGDSDSRIKGQRLQRHYTKQHIYYVGTDTYFLIRAHFKPLIPDWED